MIAMSGIYGLRRHSGATWSGDIDGTPPRLVAMTASTRVDEFEELRPHLLAVAYRLTGTFADAEDVVQDAWLRWEGAAGPPADLRAWLTTVVSRLAWTGCARRRIGAKPTSASGCPSRW